MSTLKKSLIFAGGGGGSSPTRTPDNLRSEDAAELLIGLCEGPIKGLEDGEKSFFVDETPLVASDGTENYTDFNLKVKLGDLSDKEPVKFELGGSARQTNVGIELKYDAPVTRVTQSGEIDFIDVRIAVQQLFYQSDDGTFNSEVSFRIEYKKTNESRWILFQNKPQTIKGKTTSGYVKDYRIPVEREANAQYEIRVTKITKDGTESADNNGHHITIGFQQFEEIVAQEKVFENTALVHLNIKTSDQINQMPQFSGIYECAVIKVPSNYDTETRQYDGEWDGTFKMEYTNNPAWCLYDLIMNDRYGVNAYYPVVADKWDFYEAGKYCDEMVTDGRGGQEPRYTLNLVIGDAQSGPEVLNYVASTFNATIYEDGSDLVRLNFPKNDPATHIFTKENVTSTGFNYSFSDPSTRYNDISVTFTNSESNWEEDRRRVFDQDSIDLWGRTTEDFQAVGCSTESEAIRRARFRMISGLTEIMSVSFTTNRVAQNINVFDTILISDPDMNYAISGRFKEVGETRTSVTLRDPVFLEAGAYYVCAIQTPNGIVELELDVREVGEVKELFFKDFLPDNLPPKAVFYLESADDSKGSPKPFRVLSIAEAEGDPDKVTINAIEINRNKQYEADTGLDLSEIEPSTRPSYNTIPHVLDVVFTETYVANKKETQLIISPVLDTNKYPYYSGNFRVWSKPVDGTQGEDGNYTWNELELHYGDTVINHPVGEYEFRVLPLSTLGTMPNFDTAPTFVYEIADNTRAPGDVYNFQAKPNINNVVLTWDKVEDADLVGYEIRIGEKWDEGEVLATFVTDTTFTHNTNVTNEIRYMIKAVDAFGVYSINYAYTTASLSAPKEITAFYATPNRDSIRFDWEVEPENGVEYEVKVGASWDSGITLFRTKGTNQTVLNPSGSEQGFMIKAVSQAGVYSDNFRYTRVKMDLHQNRNVILEIDNVENDWEGVTNGLERTEFEDILSMRDGYYFAEHYFDVHLPEVTRARNWFETEGFKFGDRLTFEDLVYSWGSEEAGNQNWLNSTGLNSVDGTIKPVITWELTSSYLNYLGLSMNNTTSDVSGLVSPYYENEVVYGSAKYSNGVVLNRLVNIRYKDVNLPKTFTLKYRIKLTVASPDYLKIMRLEGDEGNWIEMSIEARKLVLRKSDGVEMVMEYKRYSNLDNLNVMLTQTDDKIIVDYLTEYVNIANRQEVESLPTDGYQRLYIGGRYE